MENAAKKLRDELILMEVCDREDIIKGQDGDDLNAELQWGGDLQVGGFPGGGLGERVKSYGLGWS